MNQIAIVYLCVILALVVLIIFCLLNDKPAKAEAKPVTTEIPEYTMKCTVFEDTCKEYTIYRITRN